MNLGVINESVNLSPSPLQKKPKQNFKLVCVRVRSEEWLIFYKSNKWSPGLGFFSSRQLWHSVDCMLSLKFSGPMCTVYIFLFFMCSCRFYI